jgi:hypothetical protein
VVAAVCGRERLGFAGALGGDFLEEKRRGRGGWSGWRRPCEAEEQTSTRASLEGALPT